MNILFFIEVMLAIFILNKFGPSSPYSVGFLVRDFFVTGKKSLPVMKISQNNTYSKRQGRQPISYIKVFILYKIMSLFYKSAIKSNQKLFV